MMDIFDWIQTELQPQECTSDQFIYDQMESQSGRCLPVIYQPFDANNPLHWRDRGSLFDFLYSTQGEGKKLLDFGPGDGWPSLIVAPFAGEVVGVDGSRRRVDVCNQNARRLDIANAVFVHTPPGNPLPYADETFDGVMAASSIEQTPDPRLTLAELYRVLRPGGRLRIAYEALGRYRNGEEREVWLGEIDDQQCLLYLYDRHIEEQYVRQYALTFPLPAKAIQAHFAPEKDALSIADITATRLDRIRPSIHQARFMKTLHPSGKTLAAWLAEAGFRQVLPSHSGAWFAGVLFHQIPTSRRPAGLQGVDELLRPAVKTVIQMAAPLDLDPMLTAIK